MTDDELEQMLRRGLSSRAADVVDGAGRAEAAHAGRRRRRRVGAGVAAAAAAAIIVPVAVVATSIDGSRQLPQAQQPVASPSETPPPGDGWRTESYNGVQLSVPSSWGWGGVPVELEGGLHQCGDGAFAVPTASGGTRYPLNGDLATPYVGRPAGISDDCGGLPTDDVAHVWFDSPLPVGSPQSQTTVRVQGLAAFNITVTDQNGAERQSIIDSIESVRTDDNGCSVTPRQGPWGSGPPPPGQVTSVSVCVYFARLEGRRRYLSYSTVVTSEADRLVGVIAAADRVTGVENASGCVALYGLAGVQLIANAGDRSFTYWVDACRRAPIYYQGLRGAPYVLTAASVRLWAVDGVAVYARGVGEGPGNGLTPYLPGP